MLLSFEVLELFNINVVVFGFLLHIVSELFGMIVLVTLWRARACWFKTTS